MLHLKSPTRTCVGIVHIVTGADVQTQETRLEEISADVLILAGMNKFEMVRRTFQGLGCQSDMLKSGTGFH